MSWLTSYNFTMLQIWTKIAKMEAHMQNGRLTFKNAANTMQHERVHLPYLADAMQNERFYLHNAGWRCRMLNILEIPGKRRLFVSLLFWPWWFRLFSSSWFYTALRVSWLHGFVCVHLTATTATRVRKSQTQPTPKRRPQHQQLWACSSSYINNNHNSNSNNNSNNNKKLLLQL